MRLHSLIVKNYRIHRHRRVDFDERVTLIAGKNETGKSTLLDALSKAFFLRSKGNSEDHRSIRSRLHAGPPEVEVVFSVGRETYTLHKCFKGAGGTSRLQVHGGPTMSGDEVEDRLGELLQVDGAKKLDGQWGHLLIRQRCSGNDPAIDARAQSENLVRRLQTEGGAAVMLSPRDQAVAAHFEQMVSENFKQDGEPKANTPLARAREELDAARQRLADARKRQDDLIRAASEYRDALANIRDKTGQLDKLRPEFEGVQTKLREAEQLVSNLRTLKLEASGHAAEHARLTDGERSIANAEKSLKESEAKIAPLEKEQENAKQALALLSQNVSTKDTEYGVADKKESAAHQRHELAVALVTSFEKTKSLEALAKQAAGIAKLRDQIKKQRKSLNGIPEIDQDALEELKELDKAASSAKASMDATATRLRVIAMDVPVTVGKKSLSVGEELTLTAEAELRIGKGVRVTLTPGGENSLEEARAEWEQAVEQLRGKLREHGVPTVKDAQKAVAERVKVEARLEQLADSLDEADADNVEASLEEAQVELAQAQSKFEALLKQCGGVPKLADLAAARKFADQSQTELRQARNDKTKAESARSKARDACSKAREARDSCSSKISDVREEIATFKGELVGLLRDYGNKQARQAKLAAALDAKQVSEDVVRKAEARLEELQIEQLRRAVNRLGKSIAAAEESLKSSETSQAVAGAALQRDGDTDPEADCRRAEVLYGAAADSVKVATRAASARKLLCRLFQERKSALAQKYTRPLADKIDAYLKCVFGPQVRADIKLEGDRVLGLTVSRDALGSVAFEFDELSGGAAEQVAAAARLAMADVLAADHGGQLPIVFDDAFTNSDSDRTAKLLDMLYLAADNGLQVIVLSCSPAHYAGSGAKEIQLPEVSAGQTQLAADDGFGEEAGDRRPEDAEAPAIDVIAVEVTEAQKQQFIERLRAAGRNSGNIKLCRELGWSEEIYESVKEALVQEGRVVIGGGRGGSVKLPVA